jgi:hypothetical protein
MRNETWLRLMSALVLVGVFAAGSLFGAGLMKWNARSGERTPPPPPPHGDPVEVMTHKLKLDRAQSDELRQIMHARRQDLDDLRRQTQTKARAIMLDIENALLPRLDATQKALLEEWRKTRPPFPPPGHGPPPQALAACANLAVGAACAFDVDAHHVEGTCQNGPDGHGPLACAPDRR